jgi:hypothetical protein
MGLTTSGDGSPSLIEVSLYIVAKLSFKRKRGAYKRAD